MSEPKPIKDVLPSEEDLIFRKSIAILRDIKLVCGGTEVIYTLKKRKVLKTFLKDYIHKHYPIQLDDIEESINSL